MLWTCLILIAFCDCVLCWTLAMTPVQVHCFISGSYIKNIFSLLWKNKPSYSKNIKIRLSQILLVSYDERPKLSIVEFGYFCSKAGGRPVYVIGFHLCLRSNSYIIFYTEIVGKDSNHVVSNYLWIFSTRGWD